MRSSDSSEQEMQCGPPALLDRLHSEPPQSPSVRSAPISGMFRRLRAKTTAGSTMSTASCSSHAVVVSPAKSSASGEGHQRMEPCRLIPTEGDAATPVGPAAAVRDEPSSIQTSDPSTPSLITPGAFVTGAPLTADMFSQLSALVDEDARLVKKLG